MTSFANALEPSRRAQAAEGPNTARPARSRSSARPATKGASGPTTTRAASCSSARATRPALSLTGTGTHVASRAMPGLPGAQTTSGRCGERRSARTSACSRPPEPTTRIVIGQAAARRGTARRPSQGRDEVVDGDRDERLVGARPARAQLERHARDRVLVGCLDDVDEVEPAERRPLLLDGRPQLLDLAVDLADALWVVLDRLHALGRERREHDVGGHGAAFYRMPRPPARRRGAAAGSTPPRPPRRRP